MTIAPNATAKPGCSSRIPIVPIRYAVIPSTRERYTYSSVGFTLETGFPRLHNATYALRAMRPGYVYVYMKNPDGDRLVIHEHQGEGLYQELTYRGLEDYGKRGSYKGGGSGKVVWADTCADEVWIGYSTHLWTNRISAEVMGDSALRARLMHRIDVKELVSGEKSPSNQKHVLPLDALTTWVEDYKPETKRIALDWTCHASDAFHVQAAFLEGLAEDYPHTQPRIPAVIALYDAEGITLDLGLMAAARIHQAADLKNPGQKDKAADPHAALKLDVERLHHSSKEFHRKNIVASLIEQTLEGMFLAKTGTPIDVQMVREVAVHDDPVLHAPGPRPTRLGVLTHKSRSPAGARLASRLDMPAFEAFLKERDKAKAELEAIYNQVDGSCADHDHWLGTAEQAHADRPECLAATLAAYDRDQIVSAQALEQSLALMMHGMGLPLPGRHDKDPRFKRLGRWIDEAGSPLHVALAAYNPFQQKADAIGILLGAASVQIQKLGGTFPNVYGATDLIAQNTTTVVLQRLKGKTRWSQTNSLLQQVELAAGEANAQRVLGLLRARYSVTSSSVRADQFSAEVQQFIASGMGELERSKKVDVNGTRKVEVIETQTLRVKPTFLAQVKVQGGGAFNAGVLYFNIINLYSAWADLSTRYRHESATNFASAIFGTISALGAMAVSGRLMYVAAMARMSAAKAIPGAGFGAAMSNVLAGKLFGRLVGWPGILFGLATDLEIAKRLDRAGNSVASTYVMSSGILLAAGGIAVLEGGLAWALGASAVAAGVPVAGWVVAVGMLLVAGGLWLRSQAHAQNHQPLELWATRTIFGNRMGDDQKTETPLDSQGRPLHYATLRDEIQAWYGARFAPLLLTQDQATSLGWPGADSKWHENGLYIDSVEFIALLPGFTMGQSTWEGGMSVSMLSQASLVEHEEPQLQVVGFRDAPEARITPHGLLLRFQRAATVRGKELSRIMLNLEFHPNQGLDESARIQTSFVLEDKWID